MTDDEHADVSIGSILARASTTAGTSGAGEEAGPSGDDEPPAFDREFRDDAVAVAVEEHIFATAGPVKGDDHGDADAFHGRGGTSIRTGEPLTPGNASQNCPARSAV
jgi:hypothetical protein